MTGSAEISDKQIADFILQKDPKGYEALYDKYACKLYGIIRTMVGDPKVVETILSQTLVQIWKETGSYDPDKFSFFIWVVNIAKCNAHRYKQSAELNKNQNRNVFELMFCKGLNMEETRRLVDQPTEMIMKDLRASFKSTNFQS